MPITQQVRIPKFSEAQEIITRFRSATTEREKHKVIKSIKSRYPVIADRLKKIIETKMK